MQYPNPNPNPKQDLEQYLSQVEKDYHRRQFLSSDPLEFVHHFEDPWDQEAVALVAAVLAYGNVKQIRKSVADALSRMTDLADSPRSFVEKLGRASFRTRAFQSFDTYVHRFNVGADLVHLLVLLSSSWTRYGSLGGHFLTYLDPNHETIEIALNRLIRDWSGTRTEYSVPSSFSYLLTAPENGSCCKRWCMFLRWVGRKDNLDLGLWSADSPLAATFPKGRHLRSDQLVMPLDTHTGRMSQRLGLTTRKSLNWKAALEVTQALRCFDALDPVRYDFALARLGIVEGAN